MPELPEVETIKRSLQKVIVGKKIVGVEVRKPKVFQGQSKEVIGRKILGIQRRGKMLIIALGAKSDGRRESQKAQRFSAFSDQTSVPSVIRGVSDKKLILPEGTEKVLIVHFKLTGQMVWRPKAGEKTTFPHPIPFAGRELPAKTTHVVFTIDGGKLFYNDLRQFGWIKIVQSSKLKVQNELTKLGPEPFDKEFTVEYLQKIFSKTSKPIKLVLMDQEKIAGVGNIYANDALWEAKILPTRPANTLMDENIKILRYSILKVLEDGLKYGGSSAADEAYIRPDATPGEYQKHFRVYQRADQKCLRCGRVIKRINLGGRGTFYCPKCQK